MTDIVNRIELVSDKPVFSRLSDCFQREVGVKNNLPICVLTSIWNQ